MHQKIKNAYEVSAILLLERYFRSSVELIEPRNTYKTRTPDVIINAIEWELKIPRGNSKADTIRRQLKRGKGQSRNIIIDKTSRVIVLK